MKVFEKISNIENDICISLNKDEDHICSLKTDLRTIISTLIPIRRNKEATVRFCKYIKLSERRREEEKALNSYPELTLSWKDLEHALTAIIKDEYSFGYCRNYLNRSFSSTFSFLYNDATRFKEISEAMIDYAIKYDPETMVAACKEKDAEKRLEYFQELYAQCHSIHSFDELEPYFELKKKIETFLLERINEESFFSESKRRRLPVKGDDFQEQAKYFKSDEILFNPWMSGLPQERLKYCKDHPDTYKSSEFYDIEQNKRHFSNYIAYWLKQYIEQGISENRQLSDKYQGYIRQLFGDYMKRVSTEYNGVFFPLQHFAFGWVREATSIIQDVSSSYIGEGKIRPFYAAEMMCLQAETLYEEYVEDFQQYFWKPTEIVLYNFWGPEYLNNLHALQQSPDYTDSTGFVKFPYNKRMFRTEVINRIVNIEKAYKTPATGHAKIFDFFTWLDKLQNDYFERLQSDESRDIVDKNLSINHWMNSTQAAVFAVLSFRLMDHLDSVERGYVSDDGLTEFYHSFITQMYNHFDSMYQRALKQLGDLIDQMKRTVEIEEIVDKADNIETESTIKKPYTTEEGSKCKDKAPNTALVFVLGVSIEAQNKILKFLHEKCDGNKQFHAYAYIKAAINEKYIRDPAFSQIETEFPQFKGKERNYSSFMGKSGKYATNFTKGKNKQILEDATEELIKYMAANEK